MGFVYAEHDENYWLNFTRNSIEVWASFDPEFFTCSFSQLRTWGTSKNHVSEFRMMYDRIDKEFRSLGRGL